MSEGTVFGKIALIKATTDKLASPQSSVREAQEEYDRFCNARLQVFQELGRLYELAKNKVSPEDSLIFKMQQMIAFDVSLQDDISELIFQRKFSAEQAVQAVCQKYVDVLGQVEDFYISQRSTDIQDVCGRLLHVLEERQEEDLQQYKDVILAVETITPSQILELDKKRIRGVITKFGALTSHASIIAKDLGIPLVISLYDEFQEIQNGDHVLLNAGEGEVILQPENMQELRFKQETKIEDVSDAVSTPIYYQERKVVISAAVSSPQMGQEAIEQNYADGVGLYRSELLFLGDHFPEENLQYQNYYQLLDKAKGNPVTIRIFDLGSDKLPPNLCQNEENPALGCRGVRFALSEPEILRTQLTALLRASVAGNLSILLPMVTLKEEIISVRLLLDKVMNRLEADEIPYNRVRLGAMIETPAAALNSEDLASKADFVQIGCNDLTQYALAVDRGNCAVSHFYDFHHPGVLRLVKEAIDGAHRAGKPVVICGEATDSPDLVYQFLKMGADEICVRMAKIPTVRTYLMGQKGCSNRM